VAVLGVVASLLLPGISAAEVAERAARSWLNVKNYRCVFESRGVYQGQARTFRQEQFFRRPGEFRLDTTQDYPLRTYVYQDRVIHYLPGGDWKHRGPLVIVRPRTPGQDALPFPFGVTWQSGGNVSLEQLVRQLSENEPHLLGTERVSERDCYRLRFTPKGQTDQYELWLDKETFLPRRVSWFRDGENRIDTVAQDLEVNREPLADNTFDFKVPEGAYVIRGDVDPHVLALPVERKPVFEMVPVSSTNAEVWQRSGSVPFPALTPKWLPAGYELVRVRRRVGRWMDVHWIRTGGASADVLKLVQQDARQEGAVPEAGRRVNLGARREPFYGWLTSREQPFRHVTLTWKQGDTRCTLSAVALTDGEVTRIARSMAGVTEPPPAPSIARGPGREELPGEPSVLPTEPVTEHVDEPRAYISEEVPAPAVEETPMGMPEISDEDQARSEAAGVR
jgi:outer membrane lipoprotein-sorting protein